MVRGPLSTILRTKTNHPSDCSFANPALSRTISLPRHTFLFADPIGLNLPHESMLEKRHDEPYLSG
jgi:hypothetical protein